MNENDKAITTLVRELFKMLDTTISRLYYDKTFSSIILDTAKNGTYKILKDGQEYMVTNATSFDFKKGQGVWVKIPSGILENMYICGIKRM